MIVNQHTECLCARAREREGYPSTDNGILVTAR